MSGVQIRLIQDEKSSRILWRLVARTVNPATRYDKREDHFLAFLYLASIRLWLKDLSSPF